MATALLSGIGLGEAAYGLTVASDTTSAVYWTLIGLVALELLVVMLVRRIRGVWKMLLAGAGGHCSRRHLRRGLQHVGRRVSASVCSRTRPRPLPTAIRGAPLDM